MSNSGLADAISYCPDGRYKLTGYRGGIQGLVVASWSLTEMPGCCGILVAHGCAVYPPHQHKGVGLLLNQMRQVIALQRGYSMLFLTDNDHHLYNRRIIRKEAYRSLATFINKRTFNKVWLYAKKI